MRDGEGKLGKSRDGNGTTRRSREPGPGLHSDYRRCDGQPLRHFCDFGPTTSVLPPKVKRTLSPL